MTARLVRRIAFALLAFYAFGQASIALAACGMDRADMAQAMTMPVDDACDGCAKPATDSVSALCLAHCTADLQVTTVAPEAVPAAVIAAVLVVPSVARFSGPPPLAYLPPGAPPRRILLHSFQV
jgi:hypothetical protein